MSTTRAVDLTMVQLSPRSWHKLFELATRATQKHLHGGWQDRLRRWCAQMDEANHTVVLSHTSSSPRQLDDMTFIAHAIEQRNIGGWQKHAFDIFAGCHPRFTGITIKPRPSRNGGK